MYEQNMKLCPYCNGEIIANAQKCKHCGKWLNEQMQICPYCMKEIPANAKKCSFCGSTVQKKKSELVRFMATLAIIVIVLISVGLGLFAESSGTDGDFGGFVGFILLILLEIYFIPTHIAYEKIHRHTNFIFLVNMLFGYTIIGWIVCLVWALNDE